MKTKKEGDGFIILVIIAWFTVITLVAYIFA